MKKNDQSKIFFEHIFFSVKKNMFNKKIILFLILFITLEINFAKDKRTDFIPSHNINHIDAKKTLLLEKETMLLRKRKKLLEN